MVHHHRWGSSSVQLFHFCHLSKKSRHDNMLRWARLESNQLDPCLELLRVSFKWLTLRISKSRPAACKAAALASELSVIISHADNAPASIRMRHWNSDPARVELASADRQSAVLADERWILNGGWGRTRTYVVSKWWRLYRPLSSLLDVTQPKMYCTQIYWR